MAFPTHRRGRRYFNPGGFEPRGFGDVLKWVLNRSRETSPDSVPVKRAVPPASISERGLRVTHVNHSTVLLQQPGCNILTDPIWSKRCSPVSFTGPKRHRAPGVELKQLPPIHTVLLSHNHYDHLDLATLHHLAASGGTNFVAPLGVGRFLESKGIASAHELDWGDTVVVAGVTIHAVPAFHFSGRGLFDRNTTLWCGYVMEAAVGIVYFAGDTAFGPHFAWIRDRFGPPRLALLPIGAYEPRWFMSPVHMNPDEAVEAYRILGAAAAVPIHHGTFQLADESIDTPRRRLETCAPAGAFSILDNGESALFT